MFALLKVKNGNFKITFTQVSANKKIFCKKQIYAITHQKDS